MLSDSNRLGFAEMRVADQAADAGEYAAAAAAEAIERAIFERGRARVIFASATSQRDLLAALASDPRIAWDRVDAFHMDEYRGLDAQDPRCFGQWLQDRLPEAAQAGLHRMDGTASIEEEVQRYGQLLAASPIDLTCLGIGVNGHIAFNEPHHTRFDDDAVVRLVEIDVISRRQQVDEGLFASLEDVPHQALSLTVPAVLSAATVVATVVGQAKAKAVQVALESSIGAHCPATALRLHPNVSIFLDRAAAADLSDASLSAV
ncbi:6-phosphogluconolactonase [Microbacterium sp. EST19A]|uniref:6-phosphogluconolactonase n=1 Tax=Microbacterium sp. EST19A TaxID=2862681 RepID=UPI001CBD0225|nr:6-phosphogluconolactonase [Microbacterium sp. EST19A]